MAQSLFLSQLTVDQPVTLAASYRMDETDRRYIDAQILACESFLSTCVLSGTTDTYVSVDGSSAVIGVGKLVCLASTSGGAVTLANAAALANAGCVYGFARTVGNPGQKMRVSRGGVIPATLTGLVSGAAGLVRAHTADGTLEMVASLASNDYPVGYVDNAGNLTLCPIPTGIAGTGGGGGIAWANDLGGGSSNTHQYLQSISGAGGAGGTVALNITALQFAAGQASGALSYAQSTSGAGNALTISGQAAKSGSNTNGGSLTLQSGAKDGSGTDGSILGKVGATTLLTLAAASFTFGASGSEWATLTSSYLRLGANSSDPGSGSLRIASPGSIKSLIIGGTISALAWDISGNLTVGDTSKVATLGLSTLGAMTLTAGGSSNITVVGGTFYLQTANTRWKSGGGSHSGQDLDYQADFQTTNATPVIEFTYTIPAGTTRVNWSIHATRADTAASTGAVGHGVVRNDGSSPTATADVALANDYSWGAGTVAAAIANNAVTFTFTGTSATWNGHIVINASEQP